MADITFTTVLLHINQNLPELWQLMSAGTYLVGIIFAIRAVMLFREYGEQMGKNQFSDVRKPIICAIIAVALLYWPSMFHGLMQTVFRTDSPISYPASSSDRYHELISLAGNIIQFIGFVAFVRGWILLDRIAKQSAQPGALAKAMTHIIGGLFAINIFGTWQILRTTIGIPG